MHRVLWHVVVTAAAVAAISGGTVSAAVADPPPGTIPALTDAAGLCPAPLTGVMNAFSAAYNGQIPAPSPKVYCWDGQNPVTGRLGETIAIKGSGSSDTTCLLPRPATDTAAESALGAGKSDGGHPCIDFVSSSAPMFLSAPPGLLWVAFAKDVLSWTTPPGGAAKPATLTQAQLKGIYNCTITSWGQVGGSNAAIVPVLPQPGSGTTVNFLNSLGLAAPGACVVNGSITIPGDPGNPVPVTEDTGVSPSSAGGPCSQANWALCLTGNAYEFANNPNAIIPYSVASWIAQQPAPAGGGHGSTAIWDPGVLNTPQEIAGTSPVQTHTGPPQAIDTINPSFSSTFTQVMWNIMRNAGTRSNPVIPAYQAPVFGSTRFASPHGLCADTADIRSYGFETISTACGAFFETS